MSLLDEFRRVSRRSMCPICGKPDWCLLERGENPTRAVCARVESDTRLGASGWVHRLREESARREPWRGRARGARPFRPRARLFSEADARAAWTLARGRARDDESIDDDQDVYHFIVERGLAEAWEEPGYGVLAADMALPSPIASWAPRGFRLIAPLHDLAGQIVNLQARRIVAGSPKTLFPKGAPASGATFANSRAVRLLRDRGDAPLVLVGEGLTDFLALGGLGLPVLSAPGTGMAPSIIGSWAAGRRVVVALDNDDAGARATKEVVAALYRAGAETVHRVVWPSGCADACDVVGSIGLTGLHEFLLEHLAETGVAA